MPQVSQILLNVQRRIAWLSLLLLGFKFWAWHLTGSVALLTDALESIVNVVTGFLGWYSVKVSLRPRDNNHPYGHGKVEFISAGVEGTLILLAGVFIISEAIRKWIYPEPLQLIDVGIIITIGATLINWLAGKWAMKVGRRHHSLTVEAAGSHLRSDAYSSFALLIGLVLLWITGWQWLDSVVALIFGFFIIITGYRLLRRSVSGIMDEVDEALVKRVIELLNNHRKEDWIDMHNLRVIQFGRVLHLDAHLTLPWYYEILQADKIVHDIETLIADGCDNKVEVFLHIDACVPYSCNICSMKNCHVRQHPQIETLEWNLDNLLKDEKHNKMDLS